MKFLLFTLIDGQPIVINSDHIVYVLPTFIFEGTVIKDTKVFIHTTKLIYEVKEPLQVVYKMLEVRDPNKKGMSSSELASIFP